MARSSGFVRVHCKPGRLCNLKRVATQIRSPASMKDRQKVTIHRRHLLGLAIAGVGAAAASTMVPDGSAVKPKDPSDKRKALYSASSPEVRNFYRVNSYPRS